ncbi:MAG: hypothetical protein PWP03_226 [Candidatus Woesearchaeota archaeon]|nr:hypothetical protein [Candidatus Woesearchaeota archaeon]
MEFYEWDIKTRYVKNKVKESLFYRGIDYVRDLVKLEYFIFNPPKQFTAGMYFTHLKNRYENDYENILQEVDTERYKQYLKEKDERKKSNQMLEKKIEQENLKIKEWLKRNIGDF